MAGFDSWTPEKAKYDPSRVDWATLHEDLRGLLSTCECAPILVRLSWHDAGTFDRADGSGGARGAQRFPDGESKHGANAGLAVARGFLQPYQEKHPLVSHADLWALAATVAIEHAGGPWVPFRAGRTDIKTAAGCVADGRLPDAAQGASHLRTVFSRMGFGDAEIVALSGAHTLGRCHADRSGFSGPWTEHPLRFDNSYFSALVGCEWGLSSKPNSPDAPSKPQYRCASKPGLMMLPTDHALVTDAALRVHAERFAADPDAFAVAFTSGARAARPAPAGPPLPLTRHRRCRAAFVRLQENGHASLTPVPALEAARSQHLGHAAHKSRAAKGRLHGTPRDREG